MPALLLGLSAVEGVEERGGSFVKVAEERGEREREKLL